MFDVYAKSNKLFRDCAVTKEQSSEEGVRANSVIFINVCYVCVRVIYMRMCNRVSVRASVWKRASGGSGGRVHAICLVHLVHRVQRAVQMDMFRACLVWIKQTVVAQLGQLTAIGIQD